MRDAVDDGTEETDYEPGYEAEDCEACGESIGVADWDEGDQCYYCPNCGVDQ